MLRNIPRESTCLSLKLDHDNRCDACKKKQAAIDEGRTVRSKKKCAEPWFQLAHEGRKMSTTKVKLCNIVDNLRNLGYRVEDSKEEITSKHFTKNK